MGFAHTFWAKMSGLSAFTAFLFVAQPTFASLNCNAPVVLEATTNIWKSYTLHPNMFYRTTVTDAAASIVDPEELAKALEVANTGTFAWIENRGDVERLPRLISDVPCNRILGLVISGLPSHLPECGADSHFPNTMDDYLNDFIDLIAATLRANANTAFAIILEPGVLPVFALSPNDFCKPVREAWYHNIPKALAALDLPNVIMYLDGANGGVFGWTGREWEGKTITPPNWFHRDEGTAIQGATEFTETWKAAGPLTQFRGLAVNVRGYNSWDSSPGESFANETTCYDLYNKARNEKRYLQWLLVQGLQKINSSMPFHNIMDTSRNGVLGIRENWSDWCNVNGAGIGRKPSADTGDVYLDAFVWASEPGVSDGTSFMSGVGSDTTGDCAGEVSFKPMPERDLFSLEYFRRILGECRGCVRRRAVPELAARCG